MYKTRHVTNSLLLKAREKKIPDLSPLKLQKLLYFLNGWYLAQTGHALIGDRFQAWTYGPVVESLYHELKSWGSDSIQNFISEFDPEARAEKAYKVNSSDQKFWNLVDQILEKYGHFSALELSSLSHAKDSPWSLAREQGHVFIDDNVLREHFNKLARDYSEKSVPAT